MPFTTKAYDANGHPVAIGSVHHEAHLGNAFISCMDTGDIANNVVANVLFAAGARSAHVTFNVGTTGAFFFELYEGPTVTSTGTPMTVYNKKRSSAKTSAATLTSGASVSDNGTRIDLEVVPSGKHVGGSYASGENDQWVFAASTDYLLKLTNISGVSARASLNTDWYEPALGVGA